MKLMMKLGGLAAVCMMLPACATATRGTSQTFNIQSTPTEANVSLSTGQTCVTPCKLKLKRKDGFTATISKQGYQTATATVDSELHGGGAVAGAGNILLGGVIGGLVDGSNGSLKSLSPNPLVVTLVPEGAAAPVAGTTEAAPAAAGGETASAGKATMDAVAAVSQPNN